jgi:hypothetical protein
MKGSLQVLEKQIDSVQDQLTQNKKDLRRKERAREIIKEVGLKTQEQLSYNIGEITTMAMQSVLNNPYDLELLFQEKRNKTECEILFSRGDTKIKPFEGGGGEVDVASFALRVAAWAMQSPKSRNVLILDEPFKHLKGEQTNRRMLSMLKEVSDKLNLQIIMVADERVSKGALIEATDVLFELDIKDGVSKIIKN